MVKKIDFKKEWKDLYRPSTKQPVIVDVPPKKFLMIDGKGDPNTAQEYKDAVTTLYPLAYGLKFAVKKEQEIDYGVMPLEGLWWVEDMKEFSITAKDDWLWTAMILQPEYVTPELFNQVRESVAKKKNPPVIGKVELKTYDEGLSVQIMYIGPYADEGPTIAHLHSFAEEQGYKLRGKHHEIYLSDPNRTAPEKLKTIIRQPIIK